MSGEFDPGDVAVAGKCDPSAIETALEAIQSGGCEINRPAVQRPSGITDSPRRLLSLYNPDEIAFEGLRDTVTILRDRVDLIRRADAAVSIEKTAGRTRFFWRSGTGPVHTSILQDSEGRTTITHHDRRDDRCGVSHPPGVDPPRDFSCADEAADHVETVIEWILCSVTIRHPDAIAALAVLRTLSDAARASFEDEAASLPNCILVAAPAPFADMPSSVRINAERGEPVQTAAMRRLMRERMPDIIRMSWDDANKNTVMLPWTALTLRIEDPIATLRALAELPGPGPWLEPANP